MKSVIGQVVEEVVISKKLSVAPNKNVELLGFGYFLAFEGANIETKTLQIGGKEILEKDWQQFGYKFYQQYKSFATNNNLVAAFTVADHLWLDYIIALLLQTDDFPMARLKPGIDESYYLRFSKNNNREEAIKNVTIFLDGLNAFYNEVDFDGFLQESADKYLNAVQQVKAALPSSTFIDSTEAFYRQHFGKYRLVPSLTIPKGMGFGPGLAINGQKTIFSVFGAFAFQQFATGQTLNMGFDDPVRLRELSVHEFGHSFVNPNINLIPDSVLTKKESLFEPIKEAMAVQGYNTWRVCLIEHFVRAGEVLIAEKYADFSAAEKLKTEYVQNRKFIYLPEIIKLLRQYDRDPTATYPQAVAYIVSNLKAAEQ